MIPYKFNLNIIVLVTDGVPILVMPIVITPLAELYFRLLLKVKLSLAEIYVIATTAFLIPKQLVFTLPLWLVFPAVDVMFNCPLHIKLKLLKGITVSAPGFLYPGCPSAVVPKE